MSSPHIDPSIERLVRVEVLVDVTRKEIGERFSEIVKRFESLNQKFETLSQRLDSIDDDVKAAKIGGKTLWVVGVVIAGALGFFAHNILPYFGSLPR